MEEEEDAVHRAANLVGEKGQKLDAAAQILNSEYKVDLFCDYTQALTFENMCLG